MDDNDKQEAPQAGDGPDESGQDNRSDASRRKAQRRSVVDRRTALERRRGPGRRRSDDRRAAEEGEMTDEQFEFVMAINEYKRINKRPFPSWTEVLDVIKAVGYRKVAPLGKIS